LLTQKGSFVYYSENGKKEEDFVIRVETLFMIFSLF